MVTRTFNLRVSTVARQLCAKNPKRTCLSVVNNGTATVCIISSQTLVAADGIPVYAKESSEEIFSKDELYIIAESGTQDVRVMITSE